MSLTYYSRIIAETQINQLSGNLGVGVYQLRFSIEIQRPAWPESEMADVHLTDMQARVLVGTQRGFTKFLGMAHPEMPLTIRPSRYSDKTYVLFDLNLSPPQMFEMEALRGGGDLYFELQMMGQVIGSSVSSPVREDISKWVTLSDWRNVLGMLGYADILVLGFQIPKDGEAGVAASAAAKALRKAHEDLLCGRYDAAVSQCRIAIEGVHNVLGEDPARTASIAKYANGKERKHMSKYERSLLVGEAIRHFSHLAHHPNDDGTQEVFSRADAQAIMACTVSFIDGALSRLREKAN